MKFKTGNMWKHDAHIYLATTNSMLNSKGELVMGKGSAKQLLDKSSGINKLFGKEIKTSASIYGLVILEDLGVGAFQTKVNWRDKSDTNLIRYSTNKLIEYCTQNPNKNIFLPFPGIGYGGLDKKDILPIIETLPDTVTVWTLN